MNRQATRLTPLFCALFIAAAIPTLLYAGGIRRGLRGQYFTTPDRGGAPLFTKIDPEITTGELSASWLNDPPASFSVRWFGYLLVDRAGPYTLGTRSDDGSWLSIDGQLVVDNGGRHGPVVRSNTVTLTAGEHAVLLDYTQDVGDYDIALLGAPSGEALAPVAAWRLSADRLAPWKLRAAHTLDWLGGAALIIAFLYGCWLAATAPREPIFRAVAAWPRAAALIFFIILTVIETWPLAAHPARLSRNDNGDTLLNEWTIAWVAHQAPRDPAHLFDGNIFYPEHDTLAYSEAMIVQSALAAPLLWAGASPVLAYNIVLLLGFALSGWTMSIVIARWTGRWTAGLLSGVLFAYNAHTLTRLPHLQAQHVEFIPLALFALDELLRQPGFRTAARLAGWFVLESLTSVYLLVFLAVTLVGGWLSRPEEWLGRRFHRAAAWTAAAGAMSVIVLAPYLLPYWRVSRTQGMTRTMTDAVTFAASWNDYLSTPGTWHYAHWSQYYFGGTGLFPGVLSVVLSACAIVSGIALRDRRARMCLVFGVAGVVLSFGGKIPGYSLLFRFIPLFQSIRAVSRFGYLGIVALAMLAGFGLVEIVRKLPESAHVPVAIAAIGIAAFEPYCAPLELKRFEGIPPIYASIRNDPRAVVAELPFWSTGAAFHHAPYMLDSTLNWKPLLNGYSGFQPPSFEEHYAQLGGFPSTGAVAALRADGVSDVFVNFAELGMNLMPAVDALPGLRRAGADGAVVHYKVTTP